MDEAKAIIRGGLGEAELRLVASFCAPMYWTVKRGGELVTRNGTMFFLNTGERIFGVTVCHVIDGWQRSRASEVASPFRIGGDGTSILLDDWDRRVIDLDQSIDIATFAVTESEAKTIGKTVLTGYQRTWPPSPPSVDRGISYCGCPAILTEQMSVQKVSFVAVPAGGVASSVSEKDVSTLMDREHMISVFAKGLPPENFDFGGISGGAMLAIIETPGGIRSWSLAGVIIQGPNTSDDPNQAIAGLEIIKARRAHFIRADGQLDWVLWRSLNP
jgi:hypothetical protein